MTSIRPLERADFEAFVALRRIAFPAPGVPDEDLLRILETRIPFTSGLFVDGAIACVATVFPTPMHLAGREVPMGALAGVASAPEHRRRGRVRELLKDLLRRMRDDGIGWCLEYPFDPAFYHRLGWQAVPSGVELELPMDRLGARPVPEAGRLELSEFPRMADVHRRWAQRFNFSLTRRNDPRDPWRRLVSADWLDGDAFLFEMEDAYALVAIEREASKSILIVEDYAYSSPAGRAGLLGLLASFSGQTAAVRIQLPDDDPLSLDHRSKHSRTRRWPLQARIADLASALGPLSSPRPGSFLLRVTDSLCEWNDGIFAVETGPRESRVSPSAGTPDAELPIQSLPLLITGAVSPESALAQGLASGEPGPLALLAGLGGGRTTFMPLSDSF